MSFRIILAMFLVAMLLLPIARNAAAQEELPVGEQPQGEECDDQGIDCVTCRDNSFYYVLIAGLIIFTILFYLRNKEKIR